jgi:6-phosphogluconolactonase
MTAPGFRAERVSGLIEFRSFENRSAASKTAADFLASQLRTGLAKATNAQVSLVVSGGSTPGPCFDHLSTEVLDWSRVTVLPSDERWVPGDHPDSNEGLIRRRLLQAQAGQGKVLPFFREGIKAEQASRMIERDLQELNLPFNAVLLGMGEDGHFASLFPDFADLPDALDPHGKARCIMVQTAGSPYLRISLTLSALHDAEGFVLLIFGEAKRTVFNAAMGGGSDYPIESMLHYVNTPLTVMWAP